MKEVPKSNGSLSTFAQTPTTPTPRIRPVRKRRDNLLLDLPIAGRLTLGFLTAAVVAALITGVIGVVRSQSLGRQSDFYQSLLATNTSLTTGADFLQLLNVEMQRVVDNAAGPNPSQETIITEQNAIHGLTNRYETLINQYIAHNLLSQHPNQISLLAEGNHTLQVNQQLPLVGSALRTWHVYQAAQGQILQNIQTGNLTAAQTFWHVQGEPTNADAQSALRALILFDQRLASSVRDAASVEEQSQVFSANIGAVITFILIAAIGWFISSTLVHRLKQLRKITQDVEQGQLNARVPVIGHDEIADVAASFNTMLETMVGLLEETRQQRDVLTNAADHLFSDMRVVSTGDLRVNASVSNDPIGVLANAFNFTVMRFRRFVLLMQGAVEQLDVLSRQGFDHAESFVQALPSHVQSPNPLVNTASNSSVPLNPLFESNRGQGQGTDDDKELIEQLQHVRGRLQQLSSTGISKHTHSMLALLERTTQLVKQLNKTTTHANTRTSTLHAVPAVTPYPEDLQTLETLLHYMAVELQNVQNNVKNGFTEVDTNLTHISTKIQVVKDKPAKKPLPQAPLKENSPDLTRQSLGFAQDVTGMARQLTTLVQEMRAAITSFELDAPNTGNPLPMSGATGIPYRQGMPRGVSEEKKYSEGIRPRKKS